MKVQLDIYNSKFEAINTGRWDCNIPDGYEADFVANYNKQDAEGNYKWVPQNIDGTVPSCDASLNPLYIE